jgi:hypothetical protein
MSVTFQNSRLQGDNMTETYINANNTNLASNYAYTFPGYTTGGYQIANVTLTNRLGAFTCNASVETVFSFSVNFIDLFGLICFMFNI